MRVSPIVMTGCSFSVTLTDSQWEKLTATTARGDDAIDLTHPLIQNLTAAGCENLEWNGHFGRAIFFDCDAENVPSAKAAMEEFLSKLSRRKIPRRK